MKVYFIRHGKAEERSQEWGEWERPLTAKGRLEMEGAAGRLLELGIRFDHLLSSPLTRARETAEVLVAAGLAARIETVQFLAPGGDFRELAGFLAGCSQEDAVALVGHLPDLPNFAETLVWGRPIGGLLVKKGALIGVSLPGTPPFTGQGVLFWLTSPRLLGGV